MEFLTLLLVTLFAAVLVASLVIRSFRRPIDRIMGRIIGKDLAGAWRKFLTFALFVVGVSSGVRIHHLEQFIRPETEEFTRPVLTAEYWGLEVYRTIISALGGMAWALLIFFVVALITFVIVKRKETVDA